MPTGIIMASSSQGATQEAIEKVLADHGYESEKPEPAAPVAPKLEDFENEEEFEKAQEEFEAAEQEREETENEEKENSREDKNKTAVARPSRKQRAIDKATRQLQEDLRKANERLAALEKKPEPKLEAPRREDFKSDAEYAVAVDEHKYQLRRARENAEAAQKAVETRLKENLENYQRAVADFKEDHNDWNEVVNQSLSIHESVYLAVMELENGPAVTYYLGKHPDFARRLAEMSPLSAAMEVGRLSTRLAKGQKTGASDPDAAGGGTKPKPKRVLPDPVKPVSTSATSSTFTSRDAAKKGDFKAFKQAQRARR